MAQNIYDDPTFFASYIALRQNPNSANEMLEKPALFSLAPDLGGKRVLDLGCGCGENARNSSAAARRASRGWTSRNECWPSPQRAAGRGVPARRYGGAARLRAAVRRRFQLAGGALCKRLPQALRRGLFPADAGGAFVFSQENPLTTAPSADEVWTRDENGGYLHYNLAAYSNGGRRTIHWFVDGVVKYHRTFSDVVNALAQAGFVVTAMREPIPSEADLERDPTLARKLHKPDFLLVQAKKPVSLGF